MISGNGFDRRVRQLPTAVSLVVAVSGLLPALFRAGRCVLGLCLVLAATLPSALAQTPSQIVYGPVSVKLPSTSLFTFSNSFSVPASVTAPYLLRVQLSAPNSLTSLSFKLNNVQVLALSDFAGGKTQVDRTVTVLTNNTYTIQVAGKTNTVITVTVFATPNLPKPTSLTPNPLSVTLGASGTLTATLSPTPTAAGTLNVSSANAAVATVPASINFASGQTSVAIPVATQAVGSAVITASANGGSASATVNVTPAPPTVTSLAPQSLTVTQGASGNLTVTISSAQTANTQVLLATSNANIASVASAVSVLAGQVSAVIPVAGVSPGTAQITASLNGSSASSQITVSPAPPTVVSLVPATSTVSLGASTTLTLTISAAQSTDTLVPLSATPTGIASIPAQVTVLAGQTSAPVAVGTLALGQAGITASLNGSTASAIVNVVAPPVAVTALEPASFTMNVGATSSFTVRINAAQSTNTPIALAVDTPSVLQIPTSVTVAQGQTSAVFTATGLAVGNAIITASANGTSKTSSVHVSPQAAAIVSLLPNPLPLQEGATGSLTVTINVAQEAGTVITLANDAPAVAQVAASATIVAGAISATIPVNALATGTANVTASVNGTSAATLVQVTPPPPVVTSITPATLTLPKGTPGTLRVTVSRAPNVATAVTLSSSDMSVASVPQSVNIAAGALFADFPVASNAVGQATITASLNGGSATSTVTITAAELTALTLSPQTPTIYTGETLQFTASGTMTDGTSQDFTARVAWTSSNTAAATINAAGLASALAAGTSAIGVSFSYTTVINGQSVTVSASTALTVKQPVALVLTAPTTTLIVGNSTTVTVTSSDPAPAGGLAVTLTQSGSGSATFPAAASIMAGGTSTTFALTAGAAGDLTVTAAAFERLPGSITFNIQPRLQINTVTPASGAVESNVALSGTGFDSAPANNQVVFRGINNTTVPATVVSGTTTQLTVKVPPLAESGPITLTNFRGTTQSPPFTVTREQDFQIVASPSNVSVPQGASGAAQVQISSTGTKPFTTLVTLSTIGLPAGVTASFAPAATLSAFQTGTITFGAAGNAAPGNYPITIRADASEGGQPFARIALLNITVLASANVTGVKGRFVTPDNQGIAGIIVRADISPTSQPTTTTDVAGNFLLAGLPSGVVTLRMDATPANPLYPIWPYNVTLAANQITVVPDWTINPPPTADKFTPIANAAQDQVVTDARFPGLEIKLPAGVTITGWDGVVKTRIAVERHDPDKLGVSAPPIATKSVFQLYFGTPMGGLPSAPIPVTFPNDVGLQPGERTNIWFYDGSPMGGDGSWKIAGQGTVSADGKVVVPDSGTGIPRFCGHCGLGCIEASQANAPQPPCPNGDCPPQAAGQSVTLATGQELSRATDLSVGGLIPLTVNRTFNPFDAFGNIAATVLSMGQGWALNYDVAVQPSSPNLTRIVMPGNDRVAFTSDNAGSFVASNDMRFYGAKLSLLGASNQWVLTFKDGRTWRFNQFGIIHRLTEQRDTNGNSLFVTRDISGRILSVQGGQRSLSFIYTSGGPVSQIRDALGRTVSYTYNVRDRIDSVTAPDNGVTRYTYVDDTEFLPTACPNVPGGERLKTIQRPGQTALQTLLYGPGRRVLKEQLEDGSEMKFAYKLTGACVTQVSNPSVKCTANCPDTDSWDNFQAGWRISGGTIITATVTDANGQSTTQRINGSGQGTALANAQGQETRYMRDATNRVTALTDAAGRTTLYEYDAKGNRTKTTDSLGRVTDMTYDAKWNKVTSITRHLEDGTAVTQQFAYDIDTGNLSAATDPLGNITTFAYTPQGQLKTVTDPGNRATTYGYNAAGDLFTVADPLGNTVQLDRDDVGRLAKTTDPRGFATASELNTVDQLARMVDAKVGVTRLNYDPRRNLASVIDPRNNTIESYQYDNLNRLTQKTDATTKSTLYGYDAAGNLTQLTDRRNQETRIAYDAQNRPTRIDYADGTSQTRTYDTLGRLTEIRESGNATSYAYDDADRVIRVTSDNAAGRHTVEYAYDALDRVILRTVDGADPTSYAYDKASRPLTILYRGQTTTYAWDNASRLTGKTLPDGIRQTFSYDDANRITQIQYTKPDNTLIETIGYGYDANGNRTTKTSGGANLAETAFSASYDAANRMTSLTLTGTGRSFDLAYDGNGNLATKTDRANPGNVTSYTWDARNRLSGINAPGLAATFTYDALRRRTSKTVNGQTIGYIYDGAQAIGETSGGNISATLLTTLAIDDVVARYTQAGARTYLSDALGSAFALARDDQSMQAFYAYSPYGEAQVLGDDEGNAIQYTARENDQTGVYFYRARYYDPVLKRFISPDPIGLRGGLNFYAYVRNNPINRKDPWGLLDRIEYVGGRLIGYDDFAIEFDVPAVSGPYGNGALPAGNYNGSNLRTRNHPAMTCPNGQGWSLDLDPAFPTNRTDLRIHPDGNVPGTQGCIAPSCGADQQTVYDSLRDYFSQPGNASIPVIVR